MRCHGNAAVSRSTASLQFMCFIKWDPFYLYPHGPLLRQGKLGSSLSAADFALLWERSTLRGAFLHVYQVSPLPSFQSGRDGHFIIFRLMFAQWLQFNNNHYWKFDETLVKLVVKATKQKINKIGWQPEKKMYLTISYLPIIWPFHVVHRISN